MVLSSQEIRSVAKLLKKQRDQLLFYTGVYTGLRISELISIKQSKVFTASGGTRNTLKVTRTKKKNTVYSDIPIHPKLRERLLLYKKNFLDLMGESSPWLFPSSRDVQDHIKRVRAHNILTEAFGSLAIDVAKTHSMRHTCLSNMPHAGIPIRTIQEISGHANLSQLQAYLSVAQADVQGAVLSLRY